MSEPVLPDEYVPGASAPVKWSEQKLDYDMIYQALLIGDKFALNVDNGWVFDGTPLEEGVYVYDAGGRPVYTIKRDGRYYVSFEGREYGPYEYFDQVNHQIKIIDGKLAYGARKDGKWLIFLDGEELGGEYDYAGYLSPTDEASCNYSPAKCMNFEANGSKKYFLIRPAFSEINGKLAYFAGRKDKSFIVYDGKEIGTQYDAIMFLPFVDHRGVYHDFEPIAGKLTYGALKDDKSFIVWGDEEVGKEYDTIDILSVREIGGTIAYLAVRDSKSFVVIGGKEVAEYDKIDFFHMVAGKLGIQGEDGGEEITIWGDLDLSRKYDVIYLVGEARGKLFLCVRKGERVVVEYDGEEIRDVGAKGKSWIVSYPYVIEGKLQFIEHNGNGYFLVKEV